MSSFDIIRMNTCKHLLANICGGRMKMVTHFFHFHIFHRKCCTQISIIYKLNGTFEYGIYAISSRWQQIISSTPSYQRIQKEDTKKNSHSLCAADSHQNHLKLFKRAIINDFHNYTTPSSPSQLPTNDKNKHSLAIIFASVCSMCFIQLFNLSTISDTRFCLEIFAIQLQNT